jgi:uncharacterized Zn finger protein (UPF0148 family)
MMRCRAIPILLILAFSSALFAFSERRCHICNRVISDYEGYYQVNGGKEVFCDKCFTEAPRCAVCKLPTAPDEIDRETGICLKCLAKLPRCLACKKPIIGAVYRYSTSTGTFCAECKKNRHACDLCGVPVGDDFWKYPDGRIICNECGRRAVFDVRVVESIMRDIQKCVEKRLGLKVIRPYTLKVQKMSGLGSSAAALDLGVESADEALYRGELGSYVSNSSRSEIILLFGLPPDLLFEAGAHEYAHAWMIENGFVKLDPELREGFAQWIAAEVLRDKGFSGALSELEARQDYPYGTGYQRIRQQHQNILEILRSPK